MHKFFCLSSNESISVPGKEERKMLFEAGLGEKRITFERNTNNESFKNCIVSHFSKLEGCGGFELLRSSNQSRSALEVIRPDKFGYNSEYLASSYLGQAVCYIRPIQQSMDITAVDAGDSVCTEKCRTCGHDIPLTELRDHVRSCVDCNEKEDMELPEIKRPRKQSKDQPICGFACNTKITPVEDKKEKESGVCPVCGKLIPMELLPEHADLCCQSDDVCQSGEVADKNPFKSFEQYLSSKCLNEEKVWDISVLRRMLVQQAMEEIVQAPEEEWNRKLIITFIGEEGIDSGGLTREFLTILYENSPVFENNMFSFDAQLLDKRHYFYVGQMVVMGIISGHPGPRNLLKHIVDFIINGRTKGLADIPVDQIGRLDAISAIEEISDSVDCNQMIETYGDLLEACGFRKLLTVENRQDAVSAIKSYYLFNRFIPSLLQFVEGLKIHGLLDMLQKFPEEGSRFLLKTDHVDSLNVKEFFKPVYSSGQAEKEDEEVVIFNFHQFLKKLERGKISCMRIDIETGSSTDMVLNMGTLLQALIGCPALPSSITEGIITFNHESDNLSTVNTCAPSINFSRLSEIKNYTSFEELMKNIVVGSYGFGRE